jgi:hypothetical protein
VPPADRPKTPVESDGKSLAGLITRAEAHKDAKRYLQAIADFTEAIRRQTIGKGEIKPDIFLVQRLALVTYKHGERKGDDGKAEKADKAVAVQALHDAWALLQAHCEPAMSNDPETLGLSGAIHKRLFDWNGELNDLNLSIWFYERGFYVKRDYYNGINAAYMYTLRSTLLADRFEAIVSYGHANMIRRQVVEICRDLMKDDAAFAARGDRGWIVLSLAEAWQGLGNKSEEEQLGPQIASLASLFGKDTYSQQRARLQLEMDKFQQQVRPDALNAPPPAAAATPAATPAAPVVRQAGSGQSITIDANLAPGRTIKSVDVSCRIEYD